MGAIKISFVFLVVCFSLVANAQDSWKICETLGDAEETQKYLSEGSGKPGGHADSIVFYSLCLKRSGEWSLAEWESHLVGKKNQHFTWPSELRVLDTVSGLSEISKVWPDFKEPRSRVLLEKYLSSANHYIFFGKRGSHSIFVFAHSKEGGVRASTFEFRKHK